MWCLVFTYYPIFMRGFLWKTLTMIAVNITNSSTKKRAKQSMYMYLVYNEKRKAYRKIYIMLQENPMYYLVNPIQFYSSCRKVNKVKDTCHSPRKDS